MASSRTRSARARAGANSSGFSLKDLATSNTDSNARSPSQALSERGGVGRAESTGHPGFGVDAASVAHAASPVGAAGYELGKQIASRMFGQSEESNHSAYGVGDSRSATAALSASSKTAVGVASSGGAGGPAESIRGAGALGIAATAGYRVGQALYEQIAAADTQRPETGAQTNPSDDASAHSSVTATAPGEAVSRAIDDAAGGSFGAALHDEIHRNESAKSRGAGNEAEQPEKAASDTTVASVRLGETVSPMLNSAAEGSLGATLYDQAHGANIEQNQEDAHARQSNASESQGHSASEGTSSARSVRSERTEQVDGERRVGTERSMTEHGEFSTHTYREYETQHGQTREVVHSMLERDGQPIAYSESRSERIEDAAGAAVMRETNTVLAEGRDASELQDSGWAQGGTATTERYERQPDHSLQLVTSETVERETAPVGRMSPLLDRQTQASLADIVEFITEDNGRSAASAQNVAGSSPGGHGFDTSGTVSMDTLGGHGSMSAGTNSINRSDTVDTTKSRGTFDDSGSVDIEQSGSFDTRSGGVDTSKGNNLEMSGGPDFGARGSQGSANHAPEGGALAELVSEHLAARNIPAAPESLAELVRNLEAATHQADSGSVLLFHAQGEDVATLHESAQAARSHDSSSTPVSMKTLTEAANDLPALTAGVQEVQQHLGDATGHLTRLEMAEAFSAPLLREIGQEGFPAQQLERIGQALQEQGADFSDASPEFQGAVSLQALAQMREEHSAQAVGDYLERGTTGSAEADVRMENTLEEQAGRLRENERSQEREVQTEAEMEME